MSGAADQTLEDELHGCIAKLLRKDYPFTQTSLINVAATAATREAINRIKELKQDASRSGVRPLDFLDLPPELRNRIYEELLASRSHITIVHDSTPARIHETVRWCPDLLYGRQPAITLVSRQLRRETLKLFYSVNTFSVDITTWSRTANGKVDTRLANSWLRAIGKENAACIKKVLLCHDSLHIPGAIPLAALLAEEGLSMVAGMVELDLW